MLLLLQLPEGDALLKALNVLMLKVLEHCNRTHCFDALLTLLLQPHSRAPSAAAAATASAPAEADARWADLVVKCLIKITKTLAANADQLDIPAVLMSIHTFFNQLGVEEIRRYGAAAGNMLATSL